MFSQVSSLHAVCRVVSRGLSHLILIFAVILYVNSIMDKTNAESLKQRPELNHTQISAIDLCSELQP